MFGFIAGRGSSVFSNWYDRALWSEIRSESNVSGSLHDRLFPLKASFEGLNKAGRIVRDACKLNSTVNKAEPFSAPENTFSSDFLVCHTG
jgi:hypothetical protein